MITVRPQDRAKIEKVFDGKYTQIGVVKGKDLIIKNSSGDLIRKGIDDMLKMYHNVSYKEVA